MKKFLAALVAFGPWGLLLAAFLDGAGLTIPGGVDALVVYLASQRPEHPLVLALIAVVGSAAGNFVLFLLARKGGEVYLEKRSASPLAQKLRAWFQHYGLLTVFIAALVPLPIMPMKIFVLCAGALGSSPTGFLAVFVGARIPRYVGLAVLGRRMGSNALDYLRSNAGWLGLAALVLFGVLFLVVKLVDYRKAHRS